MKFSIWQHIRSQWMWLPPVHHVDLTGQTVLVTGANSGLGFETVKYMTRMNPTNIVLAVRSAANGEAALAGQFISQHCFLFLWN
jgi:retinol dehydrogenase-12